MFNKEQFIADVKAMTVLELADLVKALEEEFGVSAAAPVAETAKVEALFLKRAKRYAQSEGHINAEQRADLEAFAQKYGIDEFRMEELIEEAF